MGGSAQSLFFRVFQHLLPRARVFAMVLENGNRKLWRGLEGAFIDTRAFIDAVFGDKDPQLTRNIDLWEEQFALEPASLSEQQRRDRIAARWKEVGGQSPKYIQDAVQARGFDVWVHEWWDESLTPVPYDAEPTYTARNPNTVLTNGTPTHVFACAASGVDVASECGNVGTQCGETQFPRAQLLVNKIEGVTYLIPVDTAQWNYIIYWGGETFGDFASVDGSRRDEFEDLILSLSPGHLWLGVLVDYS